jgi:hypothetical protein
MAVNGLVIQEGAVFNLILSTKLISNIIKNFKVEKGFGSFLNHALCAVISLLMHYLLEIA